MCSATRPSYKLGKAIPSPDPTNAIAPVTDQRIFWRVNARALRWSAVIGQQSRR